MEVSKPDRAKRMVSVLPGLGVHVCEMDHFCILIDHIKTVPCAVDRPYSIRVTCQKTFRKLHEIPLVVEAAIYLVENRLDVKPCTFAVDNHYCGHPPLFVVLCLEWQTGEVHSIHRRVEKRTDIGQTDNVRIEVYRATRMTAHLGDKISIQPELRMAVSILGSEGQWHRIEPVHMLNRVVRTVEDAYLQATGRMFVQ